MLVRGRLWRTSGGGAGALATTGCSGVGARVCLWALGAAVRSVRTGTYLEWCGWVSKSESSESELLSDADSTRKTGMDLDSLKGGAIVRQVKISW